MNSAAFTTNRSALNPITISMHSIFTWLAAGVKIILAAMYRVEYHIFQYDSKEKPSCGRPGT